MFNFERLEVWQKSMDLARLVYRCTRAFPVEERFGLRSQMRRSAASFPSNIAEGCSRNSRQDFARFVEIATGSTFELATQARLAADEGFLPMETYDQIYRQALEVVRMLSGLREALLR